MRSGSLKHRIEIQAPTKVLGSYNQPQLSFTTIATVWAAIKATDGTIVESGDVEQGQNSHRIIIRYRRDVRTGWRIKYGVRTFSIERVVDRGEGHRSLSLDCMEIVTK